MGNNNNTYNTNSNNVTSSSSSSLTNNNNNDIEPSFETSFADDVNGAAFKSLLKSSSNSGYVVASNDISNFTEQGPLQLDPPSANNLRKGGGSDVQPPEDLNLFISDLLEQMQSKFENMGNTILGRIDDMGSRIDTLEKSIGDLMDQSGLSEPTYGSSGHSIKKKSVEKSDDS